jgi:hypothetical protein
MIIIKSTGGANMDTICLSDIKTLLQEGQALHVSIVMPTHHKGGVDQQDPIRFKNLLRQAEEKMISGGLRPAEARVTLRPVESLLNDSAFWRQQGEGLAIYLEGNRFFYYRLPLVLQEGVEVGSRFFIRPLIPLLGKCGLFYILAVSQNKNRLLQCTLNGSVRINTADVPASLEEALNQDTYEQSSRFHSGSLGGSGGGVSIQSQASGSPSFNKDQILQYFEQVNKGVTRIMKQEQAPLILAGVDYLHPIYRKVNTYANLFQEGITGNPDEISDAALREKAWPIVSPYFDKDRLAGLAEYRKAAGTGLTSSGIEEVLKSSREGRIKYLFIGEGAQYRGQAPEKTDTVPVPSGSAGKNEDLIDLAIYDTLKHAGAVYELKLEDLPGRENILALLRY